MADLAIVFHWTPQDCAVFTLRELMAWRERARKRSTTTDTRSQRGR